MALDISDPAGADAGRTGLRPGRRPRGPARDHQHALERYLPIPREGARPPIVDMRPLLPAVGRQTMNDCAAWAFGYAARSYLEAQDQGWKPDGPERIFSPTFIYNQVNEGRDSGSRPLEVLRLLRDQGGAMLATQPYLPGDFTRAPRSRSLEEAGHFRIDGYYFLPDPTESVCHDLTGCIGPRLSPI